MPTLNWMERDAHLKIAGQVPYRILEEAPELSYGDPDAGNMLVQGDNLIALKALLPFYAGQVKCIYIDPPYNTKSAFSHYDDNVEHSVWIGIMYSRLSLLKEFLSEKGSLWISIDDDESHYLKVICDEVFGRQNFVANVVWQKKASPQANAVWLSDSHDHILVYAKNKSLWRPNLLLRSEDADARYQNLDNDPRGPWMSSDFTISLTGGQRGAQYAKTGVSNNVYEIVTPSGRVIKPTGGRCWGAIKETYQELLAQNRIWFGESGNNVPRIKRFLSEVQDGIVCQTVWLRDEVDDNQKAKREAKEFDSENIFATPKPERLLERILTLASNKGDLILDSFLGSGTTAAVAQKMGRRYIGIEMGEHAKTHCAVRLKKVIDGEQGGISKACEWHGGGGFRFFTLGSEIFDTDGSIKKGITFDQLAAHIWFSETYTPLKARTSGKRKSPFLGIHDGIAYALLYNGILGDKSAGGGNVLTSKTLNVIADAIGKAKYEKLVVYGEAALGTAWQEKGIVFKQTPYDVKAR